MQTSPGLYKRSNAPAAPGDQSGPPPWIVVRPHAGPGVLPGRRFPGAESARALGRYWPGVLLAVEAVRPAAPGARLLQRPAHLGDVARVPFRDRHLGTERHAGLRGPRRRRAPRRATRRCRSPTVTSASATGTSSRPCATSSASRSHQLVGHVEAPWLHLHFAEHRSGVYRDPLRPGALTPWRDTTKPRVTRIVFSRNGRALVPAAISGAVDVIAEAHQMPPRRCRPPGTGCP